MKPTRIPTKTPIIEDDNQGENDDGDDNVQTGTGTDEDAAETTILNLPARTFRLLSISVGCVVLVCIVCVCGLYVRYKSMRKDDRKRVVDLMHDGGGSESRSNEVVNISMKKKTGTQGVHGETTKPMSLSSHKMLYSESRSGGDQQPMMHVMQPMPVMPVHSSSLAHSPRQIQLQPMMPFNNNVMQQKVNLQRVDANLVDDKDGDDELIHDVQLTQTKGGPALPEGAGLATGGGDIDQFINDDDDDDVDQIRNDDDEDDDAMVVDLVDAQHQTKGGGATAGGGAAIGGVYAHSVMDDVDDILNDDEEVLGDDEEQYNQTKRGMSAQDDSFDKDGDDSDLDVMDDNLQTRR